MYYEIKGKKNRKLHYRSTSYLEDAPFPKKLYGIENTGSKTNRKEQAEETVGRNLSQVAILSESHNSIIPEVYRLIHSTRHPDMGKCSPPIPDDSVTQEKMPDTETPYTSSIMQTQVLGSQSLKGNVSNQPCFQFILTCVCVCVCVRARTERTAGESKSLQFADLVSERWIKQSERQRSQQLPPMS